MNTDEVKHRKSVRRSRYAEYDVGFITRWSAIYGALAGVPLLQLVLLIEEFPFNAPLWRVLVGLLFTGMVGGLVGLCIGGFIGFWHGLVTVIVCRALYSAHQTRHIGLAIVLANQSILLLLLLLIVTGNRGSGDNLLFIALVLALPSAVGLLVSRKFLKWWLRSES